MDQLQKALAINIKAMRKSLGYSQMKLAELCDLSTSYIAEIETGRKYPSSKTILKLAKVLGLKPYQLFLDKDSGTEWDRISALHRIESELNDKLKTVIRDIIKKNRG